MVETKTISKNKKAYFDYEILDSWEAGIELFWYEIRSIRQWNVNLKWAYISLISGTPTIKWMHIGVYENVWAKAIIIPNRDRKIFLHKKNYWTIILKE